MIVYYSNLIVCCPNLDIDIPFLFGYNSSRTTQKLKGDPAMDATENTNLQALREMAARLAEACDDADLLDLICKLLMQPAVS